MQKKFRYFLLSFLQIIAPILFITVFITLSLLLLVTFFEKTNIHVAGTREMWIGLIGALLGGAYTLVGVNLTLTHQQKDTLERRRLENLPILKITSHSETLETFTGRNIFTFCQNEILTSGFPINPEISYPVICISLANNHPAFNVYIESCFIINYSEEAKKSLAYAPIKYRLVAEETLSTMFWIKDFINYNSLNTQGILRINYSDLFDNQYFQDVMFSYNTGLYEDDCILEIDEAKAPILASTALPLSEMIKKEYNYMYENN